MVKAWETKNSIIKNIEKMISQKVINPILPEKWYKQIIIKGEGRGKKLGFPTINFNSKGLNFAFGVYLCQIKINNKTFKGLLHYGPKLTFKQKNPSAEVFILNFDKKIKLNQMINFKLENFLRQTKKFKTSKDLIKQIKKDIKSITDKEKNV